MKCFVRTRDLDPVRRGKRRSNQFSLRVNGELKVERGKDPLEGISVSKIIHEEEPLIVKMS